MFRAFFRISIAGLHVGVSRFLDLVVEFIRLRVYDLAFIRVQGLRFRV